MSQIKSTNHHQNIQHQQIAYLIYGGYGDKKQYSIRGQIFFSKMTSF